VTSEASSGDACDATSREINIFIGSMSRSGAAAYHVEEKGQDNDFAEDSDDHMSHKADLAAHENEVSATTFAMYVCMCAIAADENSG